MSVMSGKVLALEPYYGGSHKNFLAGLAAILPGGMDLVTLPARKWKWRMRLSGPWLAAELADFPNPEDYTVILCSTFVDVASLKGMMPEWARKLPVCTYFHENQFAYPVQVDDERDFHFALTNVTTALVSDRLAFNSSYNQESFIYGCRQLLKKSYDMSLEDVEKKIRDKSVIIHPGQDFSLIDQSGSEKINSRTPVVVWNHRWEHDKNPERFFEALMEIDRRGVDFNLLLLGESFRQQPAIFNEAKENFGERILKFGYVESRQEYTEWLKQGDVVLSTAIHEFFGISVIEAVRSGCRPLLPKRLSYPELFGNEYLYEEDELVDELMVACSKGRLKSDVAREMTERFSWKNVTREYLDWLSF